MRPAFVLFDFGGVVIRSPFELVASLEQRQGLAPGTMGIHGPFRADRDPLWPALQAGTLTERQYWQAQADRVVAVIGESLDPVRHLIDVLFDLPPEDIVRPQTGALVEAMLSKGQRLAVLTNDLSRFHDPDWIERMPIIKRFDPVIDLSHTGELKPHPAAYEYTLERLGCRTQEVLFVDDQPANVAGAREAGMQAVWFDVTDPARSVDAVRRAWLGWVGQ